MTTYPILNALSALAYISLIAIGLHLTKEFVVPADTLLVPIIMLTLFVISAAVMSLLVCLEPVTLFFDGKREEAIRVFVKTILYLASACVILLVVLVHML